MAGNVSAADLRQIFSRSARDGMSLQHQIREMLVSAILDRRLPPRGPIMSSRKLAEQLHVARNTVVLAYEQLVAEGYLVARERSGYYVNPDISDIADVPENATILRGQCNDSARKQDTPCGSWITRFHSRPSKQRNIVKPQDWQRHPYPFLYGQFDPLRFPIAQWRECCIMTLGVMETRDWAPDLVTQDNADLVEQIRTRVAPRRGIWASPDEIVVTMGAQQALYLLADLLIAAGTKVGMEDPGYPDARNIFANRTSRLHGLEMDAEGLIAGPEVAECDYVYVTPNHQCPTTISMSMERRETLLRLAEEADVILIEDDYESENTYAGTTIPALKSIDRNDRVIYVGSLSKSLAPGLRLGYIVGSPELISELRALRRLMIRHPAAYIQRSFSLFLSLGYHDALLR